MERLSDKSKFWWNKRGFEWGAQRTLNGIAHLLTAEENKAIQSWINADLRDWADRPDPAPGAEDNEPPLFPSLPKRGE